jgi:lipoate-protein ligase A
MRARSDGGVEADEALRRDEEALARGIPVARTGFFSVPALSLGVSQANDAPCAERARALGLSVARRVSGGTGVLHEAGDLHWSVVLPRSDPRVGRDYARAYDRLGSGAVRWLEELGLPGARWVEPPGISDDLCLLGGRGRVLALEGRVLGGAAQHATARALLHHGAIGCRVDRDRLARVFTVPSAELARRLGSLDELGVRAAPATLAERLAAATGRAFDE